jgi:hypothetical protein
MKLHKLSGLLGAALYAIAALGAFIEPVTAQTYDNPVWVTYTWSALDCSAGDKTRKIRGPKGKKGIVELITGMATTSFVGTSTPSYLRIGDGSDADKYGQIAMGAASAGTAAGSLVVANTYATGLLANNPASLPFVATAADTDVTVTCVASTGGSPAGVADYTILMRWY